MSFIEWTLAGMIVFLLILAIGILILDPEEDPKEETR